MNIKSLIYEEIVNYIIFITGLTKNGSLKWRCNHYIPPAFCDCLSSSPEDFIIEQRLTLTAHLKTRMVRISIWESTDIESKNGDMEVKVQVYTNHRQKLFTIYTAYFPSHDRDPYHLLPLCVSFSNRKPVGCPNMPSGILRKLTMNMQIHKK